MEEVITTRMMAGNLRAELRILVVPWIAGLMISVSGSSVCEVLCGQRWKEGETDLMLTAKASGLAVWSTYFTPSKTLSKVPGIVISGTITNSIADAKGAMETWFLIVGT
jgi:hypothetical protein